MRNDSTWLVLLMISSVFGPRTIDTDNRQPNRPSNTVTTITVRQPSLFRCRLANAERLVAFIDREYPESYISHRTRKLDLHDNWLMAGIELGVVHLSREGVMT